MVLKNDPNQSKSVNSLFDISDVEFGVKNNLGWRKKIVDLSDSVIRVVDDRMGLRTIPFKG